MPTTKNVLRRLPGWVWHALVVEVGTGHPGLAGPRSYPHLRVGVSGRANVTIDLRPLGVRPTRNRELTVTRVSFWANDPRAVVRTVQERAATQADA